MSRDDMFEDALAAIEQIFSPPFRRVLWKTIGLTLALLALAFAGLMKLLSVSLTLPYDWLATAISILGGVGLFIGLVFLIPPLSFIIAGLFFDELAETVERGLYPPAPPGRALPLGDAILISLRFSAVSALVNLLALILWLLPGINLIAFFAANAYLLGRGFFEFAALRYLPYAEVRRLRRVHAVRLFVAGLIMAAMLAVPILNLLTPLFGTAFIVRVARGVMRRPAPGRPQSTPRAP
jgi:CysZ protein